MARQFALLILVLSILQAGCLTGGLESIADGDQPSVEEATLAFASPAAGTSDPSGITIAGTCNSDDGYVLVNGAGVSAIQVINCVNDEFSAALTFSSTDGDKVVVLTQTDAQSVTKSVTRTFKRDSGIRAISITGADSKAEGSSFTLTAQIPSASALPISVKYKVVNNEDLPFQSRAEAGADFQQTAGQLVFAPGETSKTITIPTVSSLEAEGPEQFKLKLSDTSNATLVAAEKTLTITDAGAPIFGADIDSILALAQTSARPNYYFPEPLNTIYVDSATGHDSNSGATESAAKASISAAAALAQPGTHVIVKNGTYREQVNIAASGTAANPVIFKAYSGHRPVVTGSEVLGGAQLLQADPEESTDIFTTGFEESAISSSLSVSSPIADGGSAVAIDTTSSNAAHGDQSVAYTFPSPSSSNKGSQLVRAFGSARSSGKSVLFHRSYVALNSAFELTLANRMDLLVFVGLNASDVSTNHVRVVIKKDGTNNRYYFDVINSAGASIGDSRAISQYVTPGSGYVSVELGFDNADATSPVEFYVNNSAVTITSQPTLTTCVVNTVRMGAVHNSSGTVGYPIAGSQINIDSVRMAGARIGAFNQSWPPNSFASEDFESSLSAFTEVEASSNAVALSSAQKKAGSQSALMSFAGSSAQLALTQSIASREDVYVRFYMYLQDFALNNSNSSPSTNTYKYNLITLSEGSTPRIVISLTKAPQGLKIDANVLTPSVANISNMYKGFPGEIANGQWYAMELRFRGNDATTGGAEFWLNGESIAGNWDRTTNPDVYAGLNTSGMKIDTISIGDDSNGQSHSSNTRPVAGSKIYIDEYRLSVGAPAGLIPNAEPLRIYQASYSTALYAGLEYSEPAVMIQTDTVHPDGKTMQRLDQKRSLGPGSFVADNGTLLFRPVADEVIAGKTIEFGVRDVGFNVDAKDHIVVQGFNIRGSNHGNNGAVFLRNGSQYCYVLDNLIQGNAAAGVRIEGALNGAGTTIVKPADYNVVAGNHFRDNILTFGSGMRIDNSGNQLIEHNWFESALGSNISNDCISQTACAGFKIRRNHFSSAGESNIYMSKYSIGAEIYGNHIHGPRGSSYRTMNAGVRNASGGSGVHIARSTHDHVVFNNLIYDAEGSGITLRAKVWNTRIFNNTVAKVAGKGIGNGIDFQKDNAEDKIPDNNGNGILDGLEDTENNAAFNNFLGLTPSSSRCIDVEGHDEDQTVAPVVPDTSNKSDFNLFHQCGRLALFNSTSYFDATFANYVSDTLTYSGLQRDANSILVPVATQVYTDADNNDFRPLTQRTGACRLGVNCPWNP